MKFLIFFQLVSVAKGFIIGNRQKILYGYEDKMMNYYMEAPKIDSEISLDSLTEFLSTLSPGLRSRVMKPTQVQHIWHFL